MFQGHQRSHVRDKDNIAFPNKTKNFHAVKAANPMLTFLGIKISYEYLAFMALFLGSEAVGVSKLKSNSLVQLVLGFVSYLKVFRKEDDQIQKIKDSFK